MIIRNEFEQGSSAWLSARAGIVTASEMSSLVTPKFKIREGAGVQSYLAQKVAEKWMGGPLMGFSSFEMEQGEIVEDEARAWLALELGKEIEEVGLCLSDDGRCGCSPDGIIDGNIGLELKCPQPTNHVKWLLAGGVPEDHIVQVHFGMFVTGFSEWEFLSYRRNFPPLRVTVKRDEEIQKVLREALETFLRNFDEAFSKLGGTVAHSH